jgi:hypothetical protein
MIAEITLPPEIKVIPKEPAAIAAPDRITT